jgi:hypothetical protein
MLTGPLVWLFYLMAALLFASLPVGVVLSLLALAFSFTPESMGKARRLAFGSLVSSGIGGSLVLFMNVRNHLFSLILAALIPIVISLFVLWQISRQHKKDVEK